MQKNYSNILGNILMGFGYFILVLFILWMSQEWPTVSSDGNINYSLTPKAILLWAISLIAIILGMILKLGKTTIKLCKKHLKRYIYLFLTLILLIFLVDFIKIIFPPDTTFKLIFTIGILLSAFLMFLLLKYIEENV